MGYFNGNGYEGNLGKDSVYSMAGAPFKTGLNYFPLDVDIDQDDKIQLIEAKYPAKGFEVIIKLLCKIYKEGYYYKWTENEQLLFTKKVINVDINYINSIVEDAVKWGLFNENLYKQYHILTSRGIQKRYFKACERRKNNQMILEYCLLDFDNDYQFIYVDINGNNVDINAINDNINLKNDGINTIKKSKEKESKVKENIYSIVAYLNEKSGKNYRPDTKKNQSFINARLAEGFTIEDFKKVIDNKCTEWLGDPKMDQYIRPETLFGTKFESYLNQKINGKVSELEQRLKSWDKKFDGATS